MKHYKKIIFTALGVCLAAAVCACGKQETPGTPVIPSQPETQTAPKVVVDGIEMDYEIPEGEVDFTDHSKTVLPAQEEKEQDLKDVLEVIKAYNQDYWTYQASGQTSLQEVLKPYYLQELTMNYETTQEYDYWSLDHVGKELGKYQKTIDLEKTEPLGIYYASGVQVEGQDVKSVVVPVFAKVTFTEENPYAPTNQECYVIEYIQLLKNNEQWYITEADVEEIAPERGHVYVYGGEMKWDVDETYNFTDLYANGGIFVDEQPTVSVDEWFANSDTPQGSDEE